MRLLEQSDSGFTLTADLVRDIPKYAILSHTWGPDAEEVTFTDLVSGTGGDKAGYDKLRFCAAQAKRDGLRYFWVDTCCIDKSNNNELSTAINSSMQLQGFPFQLMVTSGEQRRVSPPDLCSLPLPYQAKPNP